MKFSIAIIAAVAAQALAADPATKAEEEYRIDYVPDYIKGIDQNVASGSKTYAAWRKCHSNGYMKRLKCLDELRSKGGAERDSKDPEVIQARTDCQNQQFDVTKTCWEKLPESMKAKANQPGFASWSENVKTCFAKVENANPGNANCEKASDPELCAYNRWREYDECAVKATLEAYKQCKKRATSS